MTLLDRSHLLLLLAVDEQKIANAIKAFFAELTGVESTPPRSVVSSMAGWLSGQVGKFVGGATAGAGAALGAFVINQEALTQLHQLLSQLAG